MRMFLLAFLAMFPVVVLAQTAPPPPDAPGHFTVKMPTIDDPAADTSPMVCRAPQGKSDSRIPGPRVCKTQRQWDALHAQGLDIGADGKSVVASEKFRSINPNSTMCAGTGGCN